MLADVMRYDLFKSRDQSKTSNSPKIPAQYSNHMCVQYNYCGLVKLISNLHFEKLIEVRAALFERE